MIGIILAGGNGSRLNPLTKATSKQLLAIYDKPMIYYPITTLMLAGVVDIFIIASPDHADNYKKLLGDGSQWGLNFEYIIQLRPNGIAESFNLIPKEFQNQNCVLILGDNLFYGMGLGTSLRNTLSGAGATIFAHEVSNPKDYGVVLLNEKLQPQKIYEKPLTPISNFAIPGLYYFDSNCYELASKLLPSKRGELEITDLLRKYLEQGDLKVTILARGTAWLDTGSPENLLSAANFVRVVEERQGLKIGCPEEVAFRLGLINSEELADIIDNYAECSYKDYLQKVLKEKIPPTS